jgi:hypothetical protein
LSIREGHVVKRSQYNLASTLLKTSFFRQVSELKKTKGKIQAVFYDLKK